MSDLVKSCEEDQVVATSQAQNHSILESFTDVVTDESLPAEDVADDAIQRASVSTKVSLVSRRSTPSFSIMQSEKPSVSQQRVSRSDLFLVEQAAAISAEQLDYCVLIQRITAHLEQAMSRNAFFVQRSLELFELQSAKSLQVKTQMKPFIKLYSSVKSVGAMRSSFF